MRHQTDIECQSCNKSVPSNYPRWPPWLKLFNHISPGDICQINPGIEATRCFFPSRHPRWPPYRNSKNISRTTCPIEPKLSRMHQGYLVALLCLSSWCLMSVVMMPWVCLPFVIVVFPDHTHLLFLEIWNAIIAPFQYQRWPPFQDS